jgi:hypothetical protein
MYAAIRTYDGAHELADQLAAHSDAIRDVISEVAGFHAYFLVRTAGGCTTVSVFDDEAGAAQSSRAAAEWLREHASEIESPPAVVTGGEVLVHA